MVDAAIGKNDHESIMLILFQRFTPNFILEL